MSETLSEALRLLRNPHLVWAPEFEAIRGPLADLLTLVDQSPSHQFDEALDGLVKALMAPSKSDGLEKWLEESLKAQGIGEPARDALRRLVFGSAY